MDSWQAISESELDALISEQLLACSLEQRQLFDCIKVPLAAVPVAGSDSVDVFFVVAKKGDTVIYYQDIEEGFNLSTLTPDGQLSSLGYQDWHLTHALRQLAP